MVELSTTMGDLPNTIIDLPNTMIDFPNTTGEGSACLSPLRRQHLDRDRKKTEGKCDNLIYMY